MHRAALAVASFVLFADSRSLLQRKQALPDGAYLQARDLLVTRAQPLPIIGVRYLNAAGKNAHIRRTPLAVNPAT